jgi:hypothetical protein
VATSLKLPLIQILTVDILVGLVLYSLIYFFQIRLSQSFQKIVSAYFQVLGGIAFVKEMIGLLSLRLNERDVKDLLLLDAYIRMVSNAHFPVLRACDEILASKSLKYYHNAIILVKNSGVIAVGIGFEHYRRHRDALMKSDLIKPYDQMLARVLGLQPLLELYEGLYKRNGRLEP